MYKLLIVDDEPHIRSGLKHIIEWEIYGIEIIGAVEDGTKAYSLIQSGHPDLVLLDITMPTMNGLELIELCSRLESVPKFIILTGYNDFKYVQRALQLGAVDYLLKPSTREELIMVLEEAIHLAQQQAVVPEAKAESAQGNEEEKQEPMKNQLFADYIRGYIEAHYMEDISLQDAAEQLHYSDAYFCRFFKQNFDKNFIMYLTELRVEKAKELLEDMTINVKDISQKVGFRDSSYFTKVFKRITGVTPSEYRYGLL